MRVVFVNPVSKLGGGELNLLDIIIALGTHAPEIERHLILMADDGPLAQRAREHGVTVHLLPVPRSFAEAGDSALRQKGKLSRMLSMAQFAVRSGPAMKRYTGRLRRLIDDLQPTILHTNGMKAHLVVGLTRQKQGKVIWQVQDFPGSRPLMAKVLRRISSSAARAIGITKAVADDLRRVVPNFPVDVVLSGIDVDVFTPGPGDGARLDSLAGLPEPPPGTLRVGLVAAYARWKGQDLFIDAASRLPRDLPARYYVIGGPIYDTKGSQFSVEELRERARELQMEDRIAFVPFQPDTAWMFRTLDVMVHASTQPEPFGRTIAEAMACGRPVIISNSGGAAELFEEGVDGLGFETGSVESLQNAMQRMITDSSLRERLATAARASAVRRFERSRLGPETAAVYQRALGGRV
jgi:glycosyltransferase involved in cell wall biosynthesis